MRRLWPIYFTWMLVALGAYGLNVCVATEQHRFDASCDNDVCLCCVDTIVSAADCGSCEGIGPFVVPKSEVANERGPVKHVGALTSATTHAKSAFHSSHSIFVTDGDEQPRTSFLAYQPFLLRAPPLT